MFIFNHSNLLLPPRTPHKLLAPWWADLVRGLLKCHSWGFCLYTQSLNAASTMNLPVSKPRSPSSPQALAAPWSSQFPLACGGLDIYHNILFSAPNGGSLKAMTHTQSLQVVVKHTDFGVRQHWVQAQFPPYISCVTQCKLLTLSEPSAFSSVK